MAENKKKHRKGLSDLQLIAKYDTGEKIDFDGALVKMAKTPSDFSKKKSHIPKR